MNSMPEDAIRKLIVEIMRRLHFRRGIDAPNEIRQLAIDAVFQYNRECRDKNQGQTQITQADIIAETKGEKKDGRIEEDEQDGAGRYD
jgi:hypothetical protein